MNRISNHSFRLMPVAAAVMLALSPAHAEVSEEVKALTSPDSSVDIGLGSLNKGNDSIRFGQYTGLDQDTPLIFDAQINKRDDETGMWTRYSVHNLGQDSRELSFSREKQGDWKFVIDYNEIVRNDPYIIHTGMTGIGTATPTVNLIAQPAMPTAWATANNLIAPASPAAASDVRLKLKRSALGLSGDLRLSPQYQVEVSLRTETKKGARMFGRAGLDSSDMSLRPNAGTGVTNWAVLLTPEPIDSSTTQFEGKLNYTGNAVSLTAGAYASFYVNNFGNLSPVVPGTLNRGDLWNGCATAGCSTVQQLASSTVALPPDNQAFQGYLSGNYAFTQDTKSNFKLAYTHATQNESFTAMGLSPSASAPASLMAAVNTTLAQFGVTSRPVQNLSLNATVRYEDRNDKTPIYVYNTNGNTGNALNGTTNWPSGSQTRTSLKLDGVYRLQAGYSVALGADWMDKTTPLPPSNTALFANQVLFRSGITETGVHADLRKALSETLNGSVGFEFKQQRGKGDWYTTNGISTTDPATSNTLVVFDPAGATGNRVLPIMYMDKDRKKVRADLSWDATESLSLQTVLDHAQDDFLRDFNQPLAAATQVIPTTPGARVMISDSLSLDAGYIVSEKWRVNGYWSYSFNRWNVNKASLGDDTRTKANAIGLGAKGSLSSKLSVGVDVLASNDTTTFHNYSATANVTGLAPGDIAGWSGQTLPGNYLPNINYKTGKLSLYGTYTLNEVSEVRASFMYYKFHTNDWQWGYNGVPFLYSDNTTVSQPVDQSLKFIAVNYIFKL